MKILLTGATGYIGRRLLPVLLEQKHEVICVVRDAARLDLKDYKLENVSVIKGDLLKDSTYDLLPLDIDVAYYLVHSMDIVGDDFTKQEKHAAENFANYINRTNAKQVIYLTGIVNTKGLSKHLASRKAVEDTLSQSKVPLTALRAGIIIGSGSASFEIIRDLVEKLPVMVTPKWLKTKCQPIAIRNVIQFLTGVLGREDVIGKHFDIYGPNLLTYKQMLLQFAQVRNLKRYILVLPFFSPRLSSYWLYFVTSTSYTLAKNLVGSMKVDVIPEENDLSVRLGIELIPYKKAIAMAFEKIEQNLVLSTWSDSSDRLFEKGLSAYIEVPKFGVFSDQQKMKTSDVDLSLQRIFSIGGRNGWYYGNTLWQLRGFMDKLFGGVGLRRGRKNAAETSVGEVLDFWRVLHSSKTEKRLLLYAEMKLPGEAWLEFRIDEDNYINQIATFRPSGIAGRLYWYAMWPFHLFLFKGMLHKIAK
jgi:uncharacterized protein YbjT (DUF2867 family)